MQTNQIYDIVNGTINQSLGRTDLTVIDERGLVSLGDAILSSQSNTEAFLGTLIQRVGHSIYESNTFSSQFSDIVMNENAFGAITQKISVQLMEFSKSEVYDLTNGTSVDQQKVTKPKVRQKLFVTRTPYTLTITIQEVTLTEAFTSAEAMKSFLALIFNELNNTIEIKVETMGKNCINNFIALTSGTSRNIKLLTKYATERAITLTKAEALADPDFLRWATGVINTTKDYMKDPSVKYNNGEIVKFTSPDRLKMRILTEFQNALETEMLYGAFNDGYVKLDGYKKINFWQNVDSKDSISLIPSNSADNTVVKIDNVVGILHDKSALGIFNKHQSVRTAPYNAAGEYVNTFYHFKENYFNDQDENFVLVTLD